MFRFLGLFNLMKEHLLSSDPTRCCLPEPASVILKGLGACRRHYYDGMFQYYAYPLVRQTPMFGTPQMREFLEVSEPCRT